MQAPAIAGRHAEALLVRERGHPIAFTFGDLMKYHGSGSPGGVAHAFKVLERGLPLLDPRGDAPERREVAVRTAFGGPGARDAFECVLRAVSGERYAVDAALGRPARGTAARFVFALDYRGRVATLVLRAGFVTEEFLELAGADARTAEQEAQLDELKREMAELVMSTPAGEVYDAGVEG